MIEGFPRSENDGAHRIVGDHHGQTGRLAQENIEAAEERATAGEHDALIDDIGAELGRRPFEGRHHGLDDGVDRLAERLADLIAIDDDRLWHASDEIAPLHLHRLSLFGGVRVADLAFHALGRLLADENIIFTLHISDDRLVHLIAADAHALAIDDARERDDGDLGRPSANIDDHIAARLGDGEPCADRRRHRLLDEEDLARASALGALFDGALLDLGDAKGDADDDARTSNRPSIARPLDKMLEHRLRDLEVGDDAITKRANGLDGAGRSSEHLFRFFTDGEDLRDAARIALDRDD